MRNVVLLMIAWSAPLLAQQAVSWGALRAELSRGWSYDEESQLWRCKEAGEVGFLLAAAPTSEGTFEQQARTQLARIQARYKVTRSTALAPIEVGGGFAAFQTYHGDRYQFHRTVAEDRGSADEDSRVAAHGADAC